MDSTWVKCFSYLFAQNVGRFGVGFVLGTLIEQSSSHMFSSSGWPSTGQFVYFLEFKIYGVAAGCLAELSLFFFVSVSLLALFNPLFYLIVDDASHYDSLFFYLLLLLLLLLMLLLLSPVSPVVSDPIISNVFSTFAGLLSLLLLLFYIFSSATPIYFTYFNSSSDSSIEIFNSSFFIWFIPVSAFATYELYWSD